VVGKWGLCWRKSAQAFILAACIKHGTTSEMAISRDKIDEWFGEKAKPNIPDRDSSQVEEIRIAARKLATVILANTPASSDQSVAIRKVRDAQANAFSAIAFKD
jgi:hypothetical protein